MYSSQPAWHISIIITPALQMRKLRQRRLSILPKTTPLVTGLDGNMALKLMFLTTGLRCLWGRKKTDVCSTIQWVRHGDVTYLSLLTLRTNPGSCTHFYLRNLRLWEVTSPGLQLCDFWARCQTSTLSQAFITVSSPSCTQHSGPSGSMLSIFRILLCLGYFLMTACFLNLPITASKRLFRVTLFGTKSQGCSDPALRQLRRLTTDQLLLIEYLFPITLQGLPGQGLKFFILWLKHRIHMCFL